jgi:hypothetical protein
MQPSQVPIQPRRPITPSRAPHAHQVEPRLGSAGEVDGGGRPIPDAWRSGGAALAADVAANASVRAADVTASAKFPGGTGGGKPNANASLAHRARASTVGGLYTFNSVDPSRLKAPGFNHP